MPNGESIYERSGSEALGQGEIVSGLIQRTVDLSSLGSEQLRVDQIVHPFALIATQDCDLDWDFRARQEGNSPLQKLVPSVLFIEMQLSTDRLDMGINSDIFRQIKSHQNARYYFFKQVDAKLDALKEGLPELICDFKRIFTIPTEDVYGQLQSDLTRRCRLTSPYLQHFAHRFYGFHSRVAIPDEG